MLRVLQMPGAIRRLWQEKSALAAVEFAFVLPVMLTFFLGLLEAGQALGCRANVTNMASIGADLVAQESTVNDADMTNVFNALSAMLFPNDPSHASITIYSIVDNGSTTGSVAWSCTKSGSSSVAGPTTPPAGSTGGSIIAASNLVNGVPTYGGAGSVILAYVSYNYSWSVSSIFIGNQTWTNMFYSKPRNVAQIALTSC
jgi:Flp pilus assembly protein TadG